MNYSNSSRGISCSKSQPGGSNDHLDLASPDLHNQGATGNSVLMFQWGKTFMEKSSSML